MKTIAVETNNKVEYQAIFFLVLMTITWGLTFPLINWAIDKIPAVSFVFFRFSLAALVMSPIAIIGIRQKIKNGSLPRSFFKHSMMMGIFDCIVFLTQTMAMEYTSSAKCAFITASYVVIVPFMAPLFTKDKITWMHVIRALIAFVGMIYLCELTMEEFYGTSKDSFLGTGEILSLICAFTVAITILYIQRNTKHIDNYFEFSFMQIVFTIPLPMILFFAKGASLPPMDDFLSKQVLLPLFYCALIATALLLYLQVRFQRKTSAQNAALIYCLEPAFATIFSYFIFQEEIKESTFKGGAIILVALLLPLFLNILSLRQRNEKIGNH